MQRITLDQLSSVLGADPTVTPEDREYIMRAAKCPASRRKLINAKRALEILEVSRPTLRSYVKQGKLTQINLSSRKVRFDEQEVLHLTTNGARDLKGV
ncbi:MAG: hypothetical protein J5654_07805 [Victivallales bacterium]|nr:hypothetical protein [Victivallales bacterium]